MDDTNGIERECRVFTRYLSGDQPEKYVREKYSAALSEEQVSTPLLRVGDRCRFDRFILSLARIHPLFTRAIDIYSRFFYPQSGVRKRLILLLAILESWAPSYSRIDRLEKTGSIFVIILAVSAQGVIALSLLLVIAPFLLPLQILLKSKQAHREIVV